MNIKYKHTLLSLTVVLATSLEAQQAFTSGHGDIGVGYEAGEFEPHWHLGAGAVLDGNPLAAEGEFAPADVFAQASSTRTSPNGLSSAIGVADGSNIWVLGSATFQPNLGFAAEELDPADWTGDITLSLSGWTLPAGGHFALYTTNLAGTSVSDVVFSTFDVASTFAGNSFDITPGDHLHFQWGFSSLGDYALEFTWEGTHSVDGFKSATESFTATAVPEPATTALLIAAAAGIFGVTRRQRA